jgi:hypothetical protein
VEETAKAVVVRNEKVLETDTWGAAGCEVGSVGWAAETRPGSRWGGMDVMGVVGLSAAAAGEGIGC